MSEVSKWTTQTPNESWDVHAERGRVVITRYAGPMQLPAQRLEIDGAVAHTIAKDLRAAQKRARNQVTEKRLESTMFYEEKKVNGIWYFRTEPNGEWRLGRIVSWPLR